VTRLRRWLSSRAALTKQLQKTREQLDQTSARLRSAEAAIARLTKERAEARSTLLRERRDRAVAEETTVVFPAMVPRADLMRERERADALALRLEHLQQANRARDRPA
jgi:chromosome segregation ATPase